MKDIITNKRGETHINTAVKIIIAVVIGEENSATRFDDVRLMFDYAFANYTTQISLL